MTNHPLHLCMILTLTHPQVPQYCPKGFMDINPNERFCYRLLQRVKRYAAKSQCKFRYEGELTSIQSRLVKDAHVRELVKSNLKGVYLQLTLKYGLCKLLLLRNIND